MNRIACIDLFCGAGGLTRGLLDAGMRVVRGVDKDGTAKETYERNNPGAKFIQADIRNISPDDIIDDADRSGGLLLAGCAPCQPFSRHAPKGVADERRSLIEYVGSLVEGILPEYVLVENVPGFREGNPHWTAFLGILREKDYYIDDQVVDAKDYGVPQTRRRYVLLASREGPIAIPEGKKNPKTVRETIGRFPKLGAGESRPELANHVASVLSPKLLERIRITPPNGGSRRNTPKSVWTECHLKHTGHTDTYGRMRWDTPAPTLTCRCISLSNGRFGHPEQHRAISVREAAALQTFKNDYVFYSTKTRNAAHIGNAVPPLMAKTLGEAIAVHAARLRRGNTETRQTRGIPEAHIGSCRGLALRVTTAVPDGPERGPFRTLTACPQNACEVVLRKRQDPRTS